MCGNLVKPNKITLGDILIDRVVPSWLVQATLSRLFNILHTDIMIVSDIVQMMPIDDIQLLCELSPIQGEFAQLLSFFSRGLNLDEFDGLSLMKQFCRELTCQVLVPDNSLNPFAFLLVNEIGEVFQVHLDPDNEYTILQVIGKIDYPK